VLDQVDAPNLALLADFYHLAVNGAGSTVLDRKSEAMRTRNFAPGFRLALHHKDMGIVIAAAREAGVVIPLGSAVAQLVAALVAKGGHLDHSALLALTAELSGRPAR
jgi:2-hydroxy-3-oxopropionate reductase